MKALMTKQDGLKSCLNPEKELSVLKNCPNVIYRAVRGLIIDGEEVEGGCTREHDNKLCFTEK